MNGFPQLPGVFGTRPFCSSATPTGDALTPGSHQLVQQSPDAVVLLGSAGYRFVTHGTHAAHLQPLH